MTPNGIPQHRLLVLHYTSMYIREARQKEHHKTNNTFTVGFKLPINLPYQAVQRPQSQVILLLYCTWQLLGYYAVRASPLLLYPASRFVQHQDARRRPPPQLLGISLSLNLLYLQSILDGFRRRLWQDLLGRAASRCFRRRVLRVRWTDPIQYSTVQCRSGQDPIP